MKITHIINLFRAYLIENKTRLLICSSILFLLAVLSFSSSAMPEVAPSLPYAFLFFLSCFTVFGYKNNRMHTFTLPASAIEKFIHAIVVILVVGIIFQAIALAGASIGRYLILPLLRSEIHTFGYSFLSLNILTCDGYLMYSAFLSVFLFGSIYFNRNALLKTFGIGLGFFFGFALYSLGLLYIAFGTIENAPENFSFELASSSPLHTSFWDTHYYLIPIAIIIFFLTLTYLRLRETEV